MKYWVAQMEVDRRNALGDVRCMPGLSGAVNGSFIWIKTEQPAAEPPQSLRKLPLLNIWWVDAENRLYPVHGITPRQSLPELQWLPLSQVLPVVKPVSALPGQFKPQTVLQLIRSMDIQPSVALLTTLADWKHYGDSAPSFKLACWQYAVNEKGAVLVMGQPLPSVPGTEFWLSERILIPAGYSFKSRMTGILLRNRWQEQHSDIILLNEALQVFRLPADAFVQASRPSIRLTKKPSTL